MALLEKIKLVRSRLVQLEGGLGNNQQVRASDFNPVVDYLNNRMSDNTTNTVTLSSNAGTINTEYGTITTESLTTAAAGSQALTITNSKCTANSMVMAVLSGYSGTGTPVITKVVPAAGSFVITVHNLAGAAALNAALTIKFVIY